MATEQMEWGIFSGAVLAKDTEIMDAIVQNFWNPPDGTYECVLIKKNAQQFKDDKTGDTVFGFHVTYQILDHPKFAGKEFRSQFYRFNEKGLPWTKGFIASIHPDGTAPDGAEELLATLNMAVDDQYQVLLEVSTRTYPGADGTSRSSSSEKILTCGGATKDRKEESEVFTPEAAAV